VRRQYQEGLKYPVVALLCAGTGPDAEMNELITLCESLGLKNTFLIGARGQDQLAEILALLQGCSDFMPAGGMFGFACEERQVLVVILGMASLVEVP